MTTTRAPAVVTVEVPDLAGVDAVPDGVLIEWMRAWGEARRVIDAGLAVLAGQVQARSSLEAGYDGLAQRSGARTADGLVSQVTGTSGADARAMVTVGTMLDAPSPWLAEVATKVGAGEVSVGAAAAIQTGLGAPSADVAADDLADAAHQLVDEAISERLPPEKMARRARELRDQLDADGVAEREELLRSKRFLRLTPHGDGMTRVNGLLDPETAAIWTSTVDAVTAPRRGGPRFVDPADQARADAIIDDPRSTGQLTLDAVTELIRISATVDPTRMLGSRRPAVRIHATLADLDRRARDRRAGIAPTGGAAHIEGQTAAVSIGTVERHICAAGYLPMLFDNTDALDLGRTVRLHTPAQRAVLAGIWGGCAIPGCDRPPSWTEVHHPDEWDRDGGGTSVRNGILLCRHHHHLVHNNGWNITRRGTDYWLNPQPGDPLNRDPVKLVPKNPIRRP